MGPASLFPTDHEGFLASHAGAAPWPRGVHQLHPLALVHPWGHRLLHIQSISLRLHGKSHSGLAGLSRGGLHHHTPLSHRHRDVSGHASQVLQCNLDKWCKWEFKLFKSLFPFKSFRLVFGRFPQLFPPLNPEMVAHRTVDAVRTNTAFVVLPWTMHFLVILKRSVFQRCLFVV